MPDLSGVLEKLERPPRMTGRQWCFVLELLSDPARNQTQAAIRAGYNRANASSIGSALCKHGRVAALIKQGERLIAAQYEVTAPRLLKALLGIIEFDLSDIYDHQGNLLPVREWPEAARKAVAGLESRETAVWEEVEDEDGKATGESVRVPAQVRKARLPDRIAAARLAADIAGLTREQPPPVAPPVTIVRVVAHELPAPAAPGADVVDAEVRELPPASPPERDPDRPRAPNVTTVHTAEPDDE